MSELRYDPFDPGIQEDPYPHYARLREEAPVYRVEAHGLWAVSRYGDVVEILRKPELYSSAPYGELIDAAMALGGRANLVGESLLGTDPPAHTRLRRIVNRGFTRARTARMERQIRGLAHRLIDRFCERGHCDLVGELAMPIPMTVIAEVLGIDPERREDFKRWSDDLLLAVTGTMTEQHLASLARSFDELYAYLDRVVADRRQSPRDDLISALIRAENDDEVMSAEEVGNFINLLLVAGNEATTNLIGNATLALLAHPEILAALQAQPSLASRVVDETLRWDSPVQLTLRRAQRDASIAETPVAAGQTIAVLLGSANRDRRQFFEADRFDPSRDRPAHVTFGLGAHFCIGAHLAMLEATAAIEALASRLDQIELRSRKIERPPSWLVRGPKRLELAFRPSERSSDLADVG